MSFGGGGNQEVMSEINVTPLCDIFVVLLIILMLAHDSANQQGPAIDLPQRMEIQPDDKKEQDECNITLTPDLGYVYVASGDSSFKVTLEELPAKLQNLLPATARKQVMIRSHPEVPLERAVKVMGIAYANGAKAIGLGTMIRQLNP